jgi:hypothetical protein
MASLALSLKPLASHSRLVPFRVGVTTSNLQNLFLPSGSSLGSLSHLHCISYFFLAEFLTLDSGSITSPLAVVVFNRPRATISELSSTALLHHKRDFSPESINGYPGQNVTS